MNKKIKLIIRSILVYFIFFNSIYIQYALIRIMKYNIKEITKSQTIYISVYSSIIVSFILLIIYRKDLIEEFKKFKKDLLKNIDTGLICWLTGIIIMIIINFILITVFKSNGANNENAVQELIKISPWIMGIDICLIAPFNEELVFRKAIKDIIKNKYLFVFLSFLIFGGAHVVSSAKTLVDCLYIIPYGVLGAVFAIAYYKTDTVYTSMTFHIIHNTMAFLISKKKKI